MVEQFYYREMLFCNERLLFKLWSRIRSVIMIKIMIMTSHKSVACLGQEKYVYGLMGNLEGS